MPSDYMDYENNLAFAPTSADDLNKQKRESEVLIKAIEKCEKLEKAIKGYKQVLACIDCERLPARMRKAYYEHSMESINWVFENMLDEQFNLKDDLDD